MNLTVLVCVRLIFGSMQNYMPRTPFLYFQSNDKSTTQSTTSKTVIIRGEIKAAEILRMNPISDSPRA